MDTINPVNKIRIEWIYFDRPQMTLDQFCDSRVVDPNEHFMDASIGCSTVVFGFTFRKTGNGCILEGKTLRPVGLGEVALIMLDLHITYSDQFKLTTWNNRRRLYRRFEWYPKTGYIHQWDLEKIQWLGNCPRSDDHGERSFWLAQMCQAAKQNKRTGGKWCHVCEYGADAVNEDPFWRIQLE